MVKKRSKSLFVVALLCVGLGCLCYSISTPTSFFKNQRDTTIHQTTDSTADVIKKTKFIWRDSKEKEYPVYIKSNGSCFVIKTSAKTRDQYRVYLDPEISKQICKELGVEYNR